MHHCELRGDRAPLLDRAGRAGGSGQRASRARSRTAGAKGEPPELAGDAGWRCLDGENPMENPREVGFWKSKEVFWQVDLRIL